MFGQMYERALDGERCFVYTGYLIPRMIYGDARIPVHDDHVMFGRRPQDQYPEVGEDSVRDWSQGPRVSSGAGWQAGLDAGMRQYAERLGWEGLIVGWPADLSTIGVPRANPTRWEGEFV